MKKPPIKALESIKRYCEGTQCRKCVFGVRHINYTEFVGCSLQESTPIDWVIDKSEEEE